MHAPARHSPHTVALRQRLGDAWQRMEGGMDRCFGARANPMRHLGALAYLMFWLITASGAYLFAFFETSVSGAHASVQALSGRGLGGIARSLHRYASDALVLLVALHVLREFALRRDFGFRWFTWVSGVPLLWLMLFAGIGGFWLVWDEVALFSLGATLEWFDALGLFGEPLARNVLTPERLDDRLFSLLVFLHVGVPLALLLGMYIHIQRVSRPDTRPAPALTLGTLGVLLALSLAQPVISAAPADVARVAAALALDWFYLAPHALMYQWSPAALWVLMGGATLLLVALPLLPHPGRMPAAQVDARHCNGCRRCVDDCPYAAITMAVHPDPRRGMEVAVVDAALCAACGICAGACPSSTPFRKAARLDTGIDLPLLTMDTLRARVDAALTALRGDMRVLVFGCDAGADVHALQSGDTATLSLVCAGQLPPGFVEYALRHGAHGVLVAACAEDGCQFRLGARWSAERLQGRRAPHLRPHVPAHAWRLVHAARHDLRALRAGLSALRNALHAHVAAPSERAHA